MPDRLRHFRGYWNIENTKPWVEMFVVKRMSAVAIGREVGADPSTVTTWLRRHGVEVYQGLHRIDRDPIRISSELKQLLKKGPEEVVKFLNEKVWGVAATPVGLEQVRKYCAFANLPFEKGVIAAASELRMHRDSVREWTRGTDKPYLIRAADATAARTDLKPGYKSLAMHLSAGGNVQEGWIRVPTTIRNHEDLVAILRQIHSIDDIYGRAERFGIPKQSIEQMRLDFLAYIFGMIVGDSGKLGGEQERFASMRLDLHLSMKQPTNEALGEFVCMCANALGISMDRARDKPPTGATRSSKKPTPAFRWTSESSPLLAWMFSVGLGLRWDQLTSYDPVNMNWIFETPVEFRKRFIQGMADSDGCARDYTVEITSVPNSDLVTEILHSLGLKSANTRTENGLPMRTVVKNAEAASLPIFNEFVRSYRYRQLLDIG
ncbi:MAG: hypothetical protein OK441_03175 [Thaumarchaeota archaeon]|nr:hypothetical protein [Nitrososphaerota archaeon]